MADNSGFFSDKSEWMETDQRRIYLAKAKRIFADKIRKKIHVYPFSALDEKSVFIRQIRVPIPCASFVAAFFLGTMEI